MTSWAWFCNPKRIDSLYNVASESCIVTLLAKLYKEEPQWREIVCAKCSGWTETYVCCNLACWGLQPQARKHCEHNITYALNSCPHFANLKLYSCNSNWMFAEVCLRWTGTRHAADSLSLAAFAAPPYNWGILPFCMVAQIHKFVLLVLSCQNHLEVWQDRLVARLQLEHRLPLGCLMFWLSQSVN